MLTLIRGTSEGRVLVSRYPHSQHEFLDVVICSEEEAYFAAAMLITEVASLVSFLSVSDSSVNVI